MNEEKEIKNAMRETIQKICDEIGPRPPCSEQEAKCAVFIHEFLKKITDDAKIENFYCHPGSYRAAFRIPILNLILATTFYWIYFFYTNLAFIVISFILILTSAIIIQTNLMRNIELIDPFFKKKKSTNVHARFKPKQEVKRIVVIGGHHDSHWEFPLLKRWPKFYTSLMGIPMIFTFIMLGIYGLKLILYLFFIKFLVVQTVDFLFLLIQTALIPLLIYIAINCVSNNPVMGADDNLTSIAIIFEIAKYLKASDGLNHTEIWLVSHGCEEIGDRGSKRFSKKYLDDLKNALVINIDMVGGKGSELKIDIMEVRSLIKLNDELGKELSKIAAELNISHEIGNVIFFTDSMAYAQNGIKACSIVGAPKKGFALHYHTLDDTIDKIDFNNLWNCFRILIEFLKRIDKDRIQIE